MIVFEDTVERARQLRCFLPSIPDKCSKEKVKFRFLSLKSVSGVWDCLDPAKLPANAGDLGLPEILS